MQKFLFYLAVIIAMFIGTLVFQDTPAALKWIAAIAYWPTISIFCGTIILMAAIVQQLKD